MKKLLSTILIILVMVSCNSKNHYYVQCFNGGDLILAMEAKMIKNYKRTGLKITGLYGEEVQIKGSAACVIDKRYPKMDHPKEEK